jgi:hypothetical protein
MSDITADQLAWEKQYQWAVTWTPEGEEEIMKSFADAWALSQPYPDNNIPWIYTRKAEIRARFHTGETKIRVAWVEGDEGTAVWIERF